MEGEGEVEGIRIDRQPSTLVTEGLAEVQFPSSQDVFYNPVQEFNRDLSVAVLRVFAAEWKEQEKERKLKQKLKEERKERAAGEQEPAPNTAEKDDSVSNKSDRKTPENSTTATSSKDKTMGALQGEGEEKPLKLLPPGVRDEEGIRVLEGLAASGLRSIRYAREVGGVREVVANDISTQALECMKHNIGHNNVSHIVTPSHSDASMVMYQNREPSKRFHAIDLDPYGSPQAFLDGAVQSVVDGGLLLVTCTDMAVLCGNSPETCYTKYGALSIKSKACHEIALRIVLQCLESHANRYGRYTVPLLSLSADFYVRVVVRVHTSKVRCKQTFTKVSWLYKCVGCDTTTLQPLGRVVVNGPSVKYQLSPGPPVSPACVHCGHRHLVAGPVWSGPLHDRGFLARLRGSLVEGELGTYRRLYGVLSVMEEELEDVPLFYVLDRLSNIVSTNLCKMVVFRSALLNAGHRVSLSHAERASIKTDAPASVVWDVVRAWEKEHPANRAKMQADHPGRRILEGEITTPVSFQLHPQANPESRKKELLRFQEKPEPFWGPKSRAKTSLFHGDQGKKRLRNQGKKRKCNGADKNSSGKQAREGDTTAEEVDADHQMTANA